MTKETTRMQRVVRFFMTAMAVSLLSCLMAATESYTVQAASAKSSISSTSTTSKKKKTKKKTSESAASKTKTSKTKTSKTKSSKTKTSTSNSTKKKSSKTKTTKKKTTSKTTSSKKNQTTDISSRVGFVKVGSRWYYYGENHKKQTGWIVVNGKRYFGKKSGTGKGSLLTGWQTIGGVEYYFSPKGGAGVYGRAYAGCTRKVNGISCRFNAEGAFVGCRYAGSGSGFVNRVGEMARDNQRKNNILATVVVAQAILESGYGSTRPYNNLFGLYGGRYSSEAECMEAYNTYIRTYFPSLIGCLNYYTYATRIGNGGYAQAGGYASALLQIIQRDGLTKYAR